jgi:excisionase family DNA binding protein
MTMMKLDPSLLRERLITEQEMYLTKCEVAKLLSVTPRTIDNWAKKKGFPQIRVGSRLVRYKLSDIHKYLAP